MQYIDEFNEIHRDICDLYEWHEDDSDCWKFEDITCTLKVLVDDLIAKHSINECDNLYVMCFTFIIVETTIQSSIFNENLED